MVQYKLLRDLDGSLNGAVQRTKDGIISVIPNCPDNRDWVAYQVWVSAGNTPEAA